MTLIEISLGTLWWALGSCGFLFWWNRQYEAIGPVDIFIGLLSGILGPAAWIVGWTVHGPYVRGRP